MYVSNIYLDRWSFSKSATVGIDQNEKNCHQKTHTSWHLNEKKPIFSVNSTSGINFALYISKYLLYVRGAPSTRGAQRQDLRAYSVA